MPRQLRICVLLVVVACNAPAPATDGRSARDALLEADRAFAAATAMHGLSGWLAAYAPDAVRLHMGSTVAQGLDSIRTFDAALFSDSTLRLEWQPTEAGVFGDGQHGFTTGRSAVIRRGGATPNTLRTGRYVTIWRLSRDGRLNA